MRHARVPGAAAPVSIRKVAADAEIELLRPNSKSGVWRPRCAPVRAAPHQGPQRVPGGAHPVPSPNPGRPPGLPVGSATDRGGRAGPLVCKRPAKCIFPGQPRPGMIAPEQSNPLGNSAWHNGEVRPSSSGNCGGLAVQRMGSGLDFCHRHRSRPDPIFP